MMKAVTLLFLCGAFLGVIALGWAIWSCAFPPEDDHHDIW